MTYVEFFDKTSIENICACLTYVPDRVICIGDSSKMIDSHFEHYRKIFSDRGHDIEFIHKSVDKKNLDRATELLDSLVQQYDDLVFDITGGDEILLVALGTVHARYPEKNIQIHRFNVNYNTLYDLDKDGNTVFGEAPTLSIEENIKIYGGCVVYGDIEDSNTYKWDLTADFVRDINMMWDICKKDVRAWNAQIGIFEAINEVGRKSEDGLSVTASLTRLEAYLKSQKIQNKSISGVIHPLRKCGLLTDYNDGGESEITVSFKNPQVKRCLTVMGQALEMKTYITAKNLTDKTGAPVYTDCLNGVVIDWDGKLHDERREGIFDTENEIDIFLMHNITPIFISCKNGIVKTEEVYKLSTVANRFGGKYAVKVLVTTSLSKMGETGNYIRQRAKDMGIIVIENVQDMTDEKFASELNNLWTKKP